MIELLYVFKYPDDKIIDAVERLNCSMASLQIQPVKMIVCNYSAVNIANKLRYECEYYWRAVHSDFNKPKLINYAVKNYIKGEYFIFSDIDLVYQPGYIQQMIGYCKDKNRVIPYNFNIYDKVYSSDFDELVKYNHSDGGFAWGNGLIHTPSLIAIRGFNESYIGYGPEDADCAYRLQVYGNKLILTNEIQTAHIYHEPFNRIQHEKNMEIYHKVMKDIKKPNAKLVYNPETWGEL